MPQQREPRNHVDSKTGCMMEYNAVRISECDVVRILACNAVFTHKCNNVRRLKCNVMYILGTDLLSGIASCALCDAIEMFEEYMLKIQSMCEIADLHLANTRLVDERKGDDPTILVLPPRVQQVKIFRLTQPVQLWDCKHHGYIMRFTGKQNTQLSQKVHHLRRFRIMLHVGFIRQLMQHGLTERQGRFRDATKTRAAQSGVTHLKAVMWDTAQSVQLIHLMQCAIQYHSECQDVRGNPQWNMVSAYANWDARCRASCSKWDVTEMANMINVFEPKAGNEHVYTSIRGYVQLAQSRHCRHDQV